MIYNEEGVAYTDSPTTEYLYNIPRILNNHAKMITSLLKGEPAKIADQDEIIISREALRKAFRNSTIETGQGTRFDQQMCYRLILEIAGVEYDKFV